MKLGELYTELTVRDSRFKRSMTSARSSIARTGSGMQRMARVGVAAFARLKGAAVGFAASVKATGAALLGLFNRVKMFALIAAGGIGLVVKNASDVIEETSKFEAVFKDQTAAAKRFAQELGKAVGRSEYKIMAMMSTLQDTFVPLGFARDDARLLSQQLTKLAIDVASFQNKASPEVMRDFQSALVGNHETVRKYGIIITEARLKQEALNRGLWDGKGDVDAMAKVQARLNLIMAGTTDAQGDAERTAGQFANKMRRLWDQVYDLSVQLGQALIPMVEHLASGIAEIIPNVRRWIAENRDLLETFGKFIASEILDVIRTFGELVAAVFKILADNKDTIKGFLADLHTASSIMRDMVKYMSPLVWMYGKMAGNAKEAAKETRKLAKAQQEVAYSGRKRATFRTPEEIARDQAARPPDIQALRQQVRRTVKPDDTARGGFAGIADLARRIQQNVFDRERQRREQAMLKENQSQTKLLQQIEKRLGGGGLGVAIT